VPTSVGELARQVAEVIGDPAPSAVQKVQHAQCATSARGRRFRICMPSRFDIVTGLKKLAQYVQSLPVPQVTECHCPSRSATCFR
jgi:hypothetical protein